MYTNIAQIRNTIDTLSANAPGMKANFDTALALPPETRPDWARKQTKVVLRDGLVTGAEAGQYDPIPLPLIETIRQHVDQSVRLTQRFFSGAQGDEIRAMLEIHDDPEAIVNTILPTQGEERRRDINSYRAKVFQGPVLGVIPKAHKTELECIAADIIFQATPEQRELWDVFEHAKTENARIAASLEHPVAALITNADYIGAGIVKPDGFDGYWARWAPDEDFAKENMHPEVLALYAEVILPEINKTIDKAKDGVFYTPPHLQR